MVSQLARLAGQFEAQLAPALLAADETARPLLLRLDPQSRTKVIMVLLALLLLGFGLIALVIVGGRSVLRVARKSHGPTRRNEDDWYRKPLVPKDSEPSTRDEA
jgi:hypothetical protein